MTISKERFEDFISPFLGDDGDLFKKENDNDEINVAGRPRETRTKAPTFTLVYDENRKDERIADFPKGYTKRGESFGQFREALFNKYEGTASQRDLRFPVFFKFRGGPRDGKSFSTTINAFKR